MARNNFADVRLFMKVFSPCGPPRDASFFPTATDRERDTVPWNAAVSIRRLVEESVIAMQ